MVINNIFKGIEKELVFSALPFLWSATNNPTVTRVLFLSCTHTKGRFSPRSFRVLEANRRVPLSPTMWVIDSVHRLSKHFRSTTHPAHSPSLTNSDELMLTMRNHAYGCIALLRNVTHLPTGELHLSIFSIEGCECGG